MTMAGRPALLASALIGGFFFLLLWFYVTNLYSQHFYENGAIVIGYQLGRISYIGYLTWMQYAVGAYVLYRFGGRKFPFIGLHHFIASFLLGNALWHIVLLAIGLAGWLFYPVMLALAACVMLASYKHMVRLLSSMHKISLPRDEKILWVVALAGALLFLFIKGAYPSGGHDYFNHYFTYYKEVIASGNLGPHETWYHYYYSKGLGLYFMSMILLDPMAIHLVSMTFIIISACVVYDLLKRPGGSRIVPLLGVFVYFICYITTSGRGIFASNGGWGDLEKTHELTATLLLGIVWLMQRALATRSHYHALVLYAVCICNVIIGFASGLVAGAFFIGILVWRGMKKDWFGVRIAFTAGAVTGAAMLAMLAINYVTTGLPQDQMIDIFWRFIDFRKVTKLGYTLELYAQLYDMTNYNNNRLPFLTVMPKMLVEFYRLYMLWPLLAVGVLLYASRRKFIRLEQAGVVLCFLICTYIFAIFFGGRSQFISFFRFSTFNYAPTIILILILWQVASLRLQRVAVFATLLLGVSGFIWGASVNPVEKTGGIPGMLIKKAAQMKQLAGAAYHFNIGDYSLRDALRNQHGRQGRPKWGGIYPPLEDIYMALPAHTRIVTMHNHTYCMLPACKTSQFMSQITLRRWYDVVGASVADGKKIMQEEGLNFIFYSVNLPTTIDPLITFYAGLSKENIANTFGILWTNGSDYLITWKEESIAPLDQRFLDSWNKYQDEYAIPRAARFATDKLGPMVKKAIAERAKHPPAPEF